MHHRTCKCGCGCFVPPGSGQRFVIFKARVAKRCACGAAISPTGDQCAGCQASAIRFPKCYCECGALLGIANKTGVCKSCQRGAKHHAWKGGSKLSKGYRWLRQPNGRYQSEHRLVWEAHHGPLPPGRRWHVHHKNLDRLDNRIENLELLTIHEHSRLHNPQRGRKRDLLRRIAAKRT